MPFYENTTGVWVLRSTQVVTGTEAYWQYRQAHKWRTQYWWKVVADDGTDNTTEVYHFYTAHPKELKGQRPPHNTPPIPQNQNQNQNHPPSVPGFELAFLLVAIVLYVIWKKHET